MIPYYEAEKPSARVAIAAVEQSTAKQHKASGQPLSSCECDTVARASMTVQRSWGGDDDERLLRNPKRCGDDTACIRLITHWIS